MRALEKEALPLQAQVDDLRARAQVIRTELRRRARVEQLSARQASRARLAGGELPAIEDVVAGAVPGFDSAGLDDLRFMRESATEVRVGYASASRQSLSLTDGAATEEVFDIAAARELW
ncbi:MAG: hypothetical protein QOE92_1554, partial [Chloroflexota bacterium]|nr:hypothetical protein [Chloroflexota bacterium]